MLKDKFPDLVRALIAVLCDPPTPSQTADIWNGREAKEFGCRLDWEQGDPTAPPPVVLQLKLTPCSGSRRTIQQVTFFVWDEESGELIADDDPRYGAVLQRV